MKTADPSSERRPTNNDSPAEPASEKRPAGKGREDFEPRYLDVPRKRRSSAGRNLVLGVVILALAMLALVQALALAGSRAALPLGTALLTLVALFVLGRSRVLRQRNGGFVALAVVCLLAALVPLAEYASNRLNSNNGTSAVQPSPATAANGETPRKELPLLTQAYQIQTPGEDAERFKVLRDLHVMTEDKTRYLIKAGEVLPVGETADDEVRFTAGDQQIALPLKYVEMLKPGSSTPAQPMGNEPQIVATPTNQAPTAQANAGNSADPAAAPGQDAEAAMPEAETPSQITQRAQKEAIRRYPALGDKDSPENQLFVETYQELKHTGATDFFADPQWPLQLAELLAKRENWQRQE